MSARGINSPLFCENQNVLRSCGATELVEVGLIFVACSSARSVMDSFDPRHLKRNWFVLQSRL